MMGSTEALQCRCGMGMMPTRGDGVGFYCPNCDQAQPQERLSLARRVTPEDIKYDLHWQSVIDTEYRDNTTPEVGSANSDDGGDTPSETEGDKT